MTSAPSPTGVLGKSENGRLQRAANWFPPRHLKPEKGPPPSSNCSQRAWSMSWGGSPGLGLGLLRPISHRVRDVAFVWWTRVVAVANWLADSGDTVFSLFPLGGRTWGGRPPPGNRLQAVTPHGHLVVTASTPTPTQGPPPGSPMSAPPGSPPLRARRCRARSGSVEHTNRAKVGLTLSDS
ncbi:hypothetical protein BGW36DRAFT_462249 [Talaromyces proteolyticus]|uniref:Uncharacterized protein n=1 Tax=Talaromyces proteolyticus TaxID=1131652 RepID=A0AAD4PZV2_9EURO|nr:hypothetical protein BGW36DRAFT_462249 [Talaromyces proteolyticus]